MCTGFIFKGSDTIFAFNLDINKNDFDYKLIKNKDIFTVRIKVGTKDYYTHGVTKQGLFAILPFMNDTNNFVSKDYPRIDLLVDRYLRGLSSMFEISRLKDTSNVKLGSLHALVGRNNEGYLVEPGCGIKEVEKFQVISNFPILKDVKDDNPFYGKERYKFVNDNLSKCKDLYVEDALYLLKYSAQEGKYSTKLSFVYSCKENKVYYCLNRDFDNIKIHNFIK